MSLKVLLLFALFIGAISKPQLSNKKVDRTLDLTTQLVRESIRLIFENSGTSPADRFQVLTLPSQVKNLAYVSAVISEKGHGQALEVQQVNSETGLYEVLLGDQYAVQPNAQSELITLELIYTGLLGAHPTEITQSERQLVNYNGSHYFYSPYETKLQQTKLRLPIAGSIESFSRLKNSAQVDRQIQHGPYDKIAPRTESPMTIHYENNSPFLVVSNLERKIEVSPWAGVVRVEDTVDIFHNGAKLNGPFSRFEYQRDQVNGISSVRAIRTRLSKSAHDIFYRDEIGNISTSAIRVADSMLLVDLKPRFPLFGGWKTFYKLGYNMPLADVVDSTDDADGNRVLRIPFIDYMYDNLYIQQATVRIILPEGSHNIRLELPFEVQRLPDELKYTYLDLVGRNVITLRKSNLVNEHIQPLEIHYKYNELWKLQEPALVLSALLTFVLIIYIYTKLDWSLIKQNSADKLKRA